MLKMKPYPEEMLKNHDINFHCRSAPINEKVLQNRKLSLPQGQANLQL